MNSNSAAIDRSQMVRWWALLALWTCLLIAVAGWVIIGVTSPPDGDSICFLPQIAHYKMDGQLVNTLYSEAMEYAPQHDGRYIWHGILFPLLTVWLMPGATYDSVAGVCLVYIAVSLVAMAFVLGRIRPRGWLDGIFALGASLVLVAWQLGSYGRPELLGYMWVAVGLAILVNVGRPWQPWVAGMTIGLLASTSALPGALLGLVYSAYVAMTSDWKRCVRDSMFAAIAAAVFFALPFLFYPYTLGEWVNGNLHHADAVVVHHPLHSVLKGWLLNEARPMAGVWVALFIAATIAFAFRRRERREERWLLGFAVLCGMAGVLVVLTSPDARSYNVTPLAPVMFLTIFAWLQSAPMALGRLTRIILMLSLAGILAVSSAYLVRDSLLRFYVSHGLTREAAGQIMERLRRDSSSMAFTSGLFVLFQDINRPPHMLSSADYVGLKKIKSDAAVVLIQQINPYKPAPPRYMNYELKESYFTTYVPKFMGIPLANSPRAYNFAVYGKQP